MSLGETNSATAQLEIDPTKKQSSARINKPFPNDKPIHDWYRFVLSFPPHLVREYISKFNLNNDSLLLDPFCGTGTTLIEAKLNGIQSIGIEGNPIAHFVTETKVNWDVDPVELYSHALSIAKATKIILEKDGIDDDRFHLGRNIVSLNKLPQESEKLLLSNSISPLPLHKTLRLLEAIREDHDQRFTKYEELAVAKALYSVIGNVRFGPEIGIGKIKEDVPVVSTWFSLMTTMIGDLQKKQPRSFAEARVFMNDARDIASILKPQSIDAVITSPPYPNEKDYTRTTRLELVILGYIKNRKDLRDIKMGLVRSNTRGVYKEDSEDTWVEQFPEIQRLADSIEKRRIELGKTSGFERLYSRVVKLYFGGMARHLTGLQSVLKPGAKLAYVVGDQASYFHIPIRTGKLMSDIAKSLGYDVEGISLFRTRLATATGEQMREEVVELNWKG